MRRPTFALLIAAAMALDVAFPNGVRAGELEDIASFLQKNIINRTIVMEKEGKLAEGTVGYKFRRELTVCNLQRSGAAVNYDMIIRISQKNWDLKEGVQSGEARIEDRVLVIRYEIGLRKSTNEVAGFGRTLTTTRDDWGGMTDYVQLKVTGDTLAIDTYTPRYDDYFAAKGTFYPGASDAHQEWTLKDGKLQCQSTSKVYRVDPKTMQRTLVDDRTKTPVIETEVSKLPLH